MYNRKVIKENCFYQVAGKLQKIEIGTVIETSNPNLFGAKAVTVGQVELEVATPKQEPIEEPVKESGSDEEAELRAFILDKTGQAAGGNSKISTLRKRAKSLGWVKQHGE